MRLLLWSAPVLHTDRVQTSSAALTAAADVLLPCLESCYRADAVFKHGSVSDASEGLIPGDSSWYGGLSLSIVR